MSGESTVDVDRALSRIVREEWGRLVALLLGRYRRVDLVEDALADALEAAARRWPRDGVPDVPSAWIVTTAGRRIVDRLRHEGMVATRLPVLVTEAERRQEGLGVRADPGGIVEDEVLRLALMTAHPALGTEAGCALTLRLVLGVSTADIARLFLVSEPTMAARLTRAKKKIVAAGIPFTIPDAHVLPERLDVLAQVAYLAFTAGYAPASGEHALRADLAGEAIRLVRLLLGVRPDKPVLRALLALELLQHSRRDARVDPEGNLVLLADQDRSRWRVEEIGEASEILASLTGVPMTPLAASYAVQARIAAEHARAVTASETDWRAVVAQYDVLLGITGSDPVRLARAVAVAEAEGPEAGLRAVEEVQAWNHRVSAVRAELLLRAGREEEARQAYVQALDAVGNAAERAHLRGRLAELDRWEHAVDRHGTDGPGTPSERTH